MDEQETKNTEDLEVLPVIREEVDPARNIESQLLDWNVTPATPFAMGTTQGQKSASAVPDLHESTHLYQPPQDYGLLAFERTRYAISAMQSAVANDGSSSLKEALAALETLYTWVDKEIEKCERRASSEAYLAAEATEKAIQHCVISLCSYLQVRYPDLDFSDALHYLATPAKEEATTLADLLLNDENEAEQGNV